MNHKELEKALDDLLESQRYPDYAPNGLQVEGRSEVGLIVGGVTASQKLIDVAIEKQADAILVHHGYFWKSEPRALTGMRAKRIASLMKNDINLYAYHLPLDAHPIYGNNARLARLLGLDLEIINDKTVFQGIGCVASVNSVITPQAFSARLEQCLGRQPLWIDGGNGGIRRIGLVTGGAQEMIDEAAALGLDAFISGEVSESTTHSAREQGIHYFAAGHHASEKEGVKGLLEYLCKKFDVTGCFVDCGNPV